jgi:DNA-binding GntR family transcriptional regulator
MEAKALLAELPTKTKADVAYERLRRAIVTHEIDGGDLLDEGILGERFVVGRTPLREALKRLALEQFVVAPPHRTPYVRPFVLTDLQPLYETRLLLEVPVSGLAAERIAPPDLADLEENLTVMREAIARNDVYDVIEADYAFHSKLARGTQNRYLAEAINQLNRGSLRLWYLAHLKLGLRSVEAMHANIVAVLRRGDRAAAEEVMREHIISSQARVIRAFASGVHAEPGTGSAPRRGAGR